MTKQEIPAPLLRAWASGVFAAKCKISDRRNDLYFDSTDKALLEKFAEVTGCGYLRLIPAGPERKMVRDNWRWATKSLNDTRATLLFVLPLLHDMKAAQAAKLIKRIEGNPAWQRRNGPKATS